MSLNVSISDLDFDNGFVSMAMASSNEHIWVYQTLALNLVSMAMTSWYASLNVSVSDLDFDNAFVSMEMTFFKYASQNVQI